LLVLFATRALVQPVESQTVVSNSQTGFDHLAEGLISAATDEERKALLDSKKQLVTSELLTALMSKGNHSLGEGQHSRALTIFAVAKAVAEQIQDRAAVARTLVASGRVYMAKDEDGPALELFREGLTESEKIQDKAGIARALNNIGITASF
jgi:hypothetical protein